MLFCVPNSHVFTKCHELSKQAAGYNRYIDDRTGNTWFTVFLNYGTRFTSSVLYWQLWEITPLAVFSA